MLRRKAQRVVDRSGLSNGSHDYKALVEILETYPRDELFQISEDELFETALGILHLDERRRVRLFVRRDAFARFFSCLVFLPRERFDTGIAGESKRSSGRPWAASSVDYSDAACPSRCSRVSTSSSTRTRARLRSTTSPRSKPAWRRRREPGPTTSATRSRSNWGRSAPGLSSSATARRSRAPTARTSQPAQAVPDIERIERLDPDGDLGMSLYVPLESPLDHLAFKLLRSGQPILLSDVLPLLENMGVRVSDERPYEIKPAQAARRSGSTTSGSATTKEPSSRPTMSRATFQDAFARTWRGEAENDGFNRLVLAARLTAREITILRAIAKYLRQAGSTFSQTYMEDALAAHPDVARRLVELFRLRLEPMRFEDTDAKAQGAREGPRTRSTRSRASTRIGSCAASSASIRAVLRTNYFQTGRRTAARSHTSR